MRKKLAYLNLGLNFNTNAALQRQFAETFSDYEIEITNLPELVNLFHPLNLLETMRTYGREILARRKEWRDCLVRTQYTFDAVQAAVRRKYAAGGVAFTFQTGSRLDGTLSSCPHFVYTDHTHLANLQYPDASPNWMFPTEWINREREIYQHADKVFTISSNVSRSLREDYGVAAEKIVCVYAGANVSLGDVPPGEVDRFAAKRILFVGMDWERKGGPLLVAAFREVLKVHPDAHLTIVGCTPTVDLPNCEVVGKVPAAAARPYFESANIFCMPTRREPFGIVYVEAMLAGLPIVATRLGALPDMVEDGRNGFLVECGDLEGLTRSLLTLLGDPVKCVEFGRSGAALAKQRYTWPNAVNAIRQHIEAHVRNPEVAPA
jgi:glycosyltransferase involved in cell wall biosynthesis